MGSMSRVKRTIVIVQIISHLGLAMSPQNIFSGEQAEHNENNENIFSGEQRRKSRGLVTKKVKSKKLGRCQGIFIHGFMST